jgi:hypothetical protein
MNKLSEKKIKTENKQKTEPKKYAKILQAKNELEIFSIDENIEYLIDKLYFIYSTIKYNSLLFYIDSYKINDYLQKQIDYLLGEYELINNYFDIKENNSKNQSGGSYIIEKKELSNKEQFIKFLLKIHEDHNNFFRGFHLLNMENFVYPIKNYYVKNKLTDIEYRDALREVDRKYKEIINSNYIILSNYLNYFYGNKGKFAYEYINLKNARNSSILKKMFPNDFHKIFNIFNNLLDSEIAKILRLIKFKNKKNTLSLRNYQINEKQTKKKQKYKIQTIMNSNEINLSNVKKNLFDFFSKTKEFKFNGLKIYPKLLFQQYPDIFKQYYPTFYNYIYLLDDKTFNDIVSQNNT